MIAVEPVTQTNLAGGGKRGGGKIVVFNYDDGPDAREIAEAVSKLTKEEAKQLLAYLETTYGI